MSDLAPGFLIAVPQLGDPNFHRALVLMLEHTSEGALGIVVNRPAQVSLGEVARSQDLPAHPASAKAPVFVGGPVQPDRGFVLHDRADVGESVALLDGLHVSSSLDSLRELLEGTPEHFRLCLGYAGWGPGQLEQELREGAWLSTTASRRHVLETPPDKAWDAVLREMGIEPAMLLHGGGLKH